MAPEARHHMPTTLAAVALVLTFATAPTVANEHHFETFCIDGNCGPAEHQEPQLKAPATTQPTGDARVNKVDGFSIKQKVHEQEDRRKEKQVQP